MQNKQTVAKIIGFLPRDQEPERERRSSTSKPTIAIKSKFQTNFRKMKKNKNKKMQEF